MLSKLYPKILGGGIAGIPSGPRVRPIQFNSTSLAISPKAIVAMAR